MAETKTQKETVERVMHEWKHGELKGRDGAPIRDRKQAVAVALSEAGDSNRVSADRNRHNLARAKSNERKGEIGEQAREGRDAIKRNRSELYAEARKRDIPGRSKMDKAQLERALKG